MADKKRCMLRELFTGHGLARGPCEAILKKLAGRVGSGREVFVISRSRWVGSGSRGFQISLRVGSPCPDPTGLPYKYREVIRPV